MGTAAAPTLISRLWFKVLAGIALVLLALVLLAVFFPWDLLRGPINRYVTEKTGREFAITRHLDVKLGRTTRVIMDGLEFANPDWAQDRHLVKAEGAEIGVRLWPLIAHRDIVLPAIRLTRPQLGLQVEPDGRRTWALGGDTKDERNVPYIGALTIDEGDIHYIASEQGADLHVQVAMNRQAQAANTPDAAAMPLHFKAQGRWREQAFIADGRTGDVLYLSAPLQKPFPAEVNIKAGDTLLKARGAIASLATLDGANVDFQMQGPNLAQLYHLVGVTLPDTPRYDVAGRLSKKGEQWTVRDIAARLGRTDMAGELSFDGSQKVPRLTGALQSRMLDFVDLAPVIGLDDDRRGAPGQQQRVAKASDDDKAGGKGNDKEKKDPNRKVLPAAPLDVSRLKSMNADVRLDAARVVNAKGLPLDRMGVHVRLDNGLLVLDPLDLGMAGGRVAGVLRIDANAQPASVQTKLDARSLELNRLFPKSESARNAIGKVQGQVDLSTRGGSVAQMLANANGNIAMLMGKGEISNILLEFAGLDGGEILKFLVEGDRRVQVRCAATAFDVQNGLMTTRALVLDTGDTVFWGEGKVDLARESMDLLIKPEPKDTSILSLRSPLRIAGTFGAPDIGLQKTALAGRAGLAVALGAINPLLALAATIETGPGTDADCVGALKQSAAPRAEARVDRSAPPPAGSGGKTVDERGTRMGAAPAAGNREPAKAPAAVRAPVDPQGNGTAAKPIAP